MKRLQVDFDDLCIALDSTAADDVRWYLDGESGDLILVGRDYEPAEVDGPTVAQIEAAPERYLPVPSVDSTEAMEDMRAFSRAQDDERFRESLELALSAPRPFRRFKSVLDHLPDYRQRWFTFRRERMLERGLRWLVGQGIEAVPMRHA